MAGFDPGAFLFQLELKQAAEKGDLARVERLVARRYDDVDTVDAATAARGAFLLVDVREAQEYAVSHLPGAVRIAPDASAEEALDVIETARNGRPVLFYCSVGVRSSELAERVQRRLGAQGVHTANLKGGIFRWAKQGLPLESAHGPTRMVHGYDTLWAKLAPSPVTVR